MFLYSCVLCTSVYVRTYVRTLFHTAAWLVRSGGTSNVYAACTELGMAFAFRGVQVLALYTLTWTSACMACSTGGVEHQNITGQVSTAWLLFDLYILYSCVACTSCGAPCVYTVFCAWLVSVRYWVFLVCTRYSVHGLYVMGYSLCVHSILYIMAVYLCVHCILYSMGYPLCIHGTLYYIWLVHYGVVLACCVYMTCTLRGTRYSV